MNPTLRTASLLLTILCLAAPAAAQRRIDMNFQGQLVEAVTELRQKVNADPELKGRKLKVGKFGGPFLPDSNFEIDFETKFSLLMQDMLDDTSTFLVSGEYDFLPGEAAENKDLRVVQFVIKIVSRQRRVLHEVVREVNNTADIARITGATVAPPDTTNAEKRNKQVADAVEKPAFEVHEKTRIAAMGQPNFTVEIRKRDHGKGEPTAVAPRNVNGRAFVDLDVTDTFEIALYNADSKCDATAVITIDSLDVANTFSEDKQKYDGYIVPRMNNGQPGLHVVPGWLRTARQSKDNVFQFVINEFGKGAATSQKARNSRGIITVSFFESVPPGEKLPSRNFGEVGKGEPVSVEYEAQSMQMRETPIAVVSIRYSLNPSGAP